MLVGKNILSLLPTKAGSVDDYFSHRQQSMQRIKLPFQQTGLKSFNNVDIFLHYIIKVSKYLSMSSWLDLKQSPVNYRKHPYPYHGGNWKYPRGGGSKAQEIPEGRRVKWLD